MGIIGMKSALGQGEFMLRYFRLRTIKNNQNVLGVTTGATGSGKTYTQLSMGESWYEDKFKEKFPIDNVCFSVSQLMIRINNLTKSKKIRRGELFILEEAGANFGNLDFQNKIAKMFSYILQSFRSMNLILLMNVPVLTMINKNARQLIHFHMTTVGIDRVKKMSKVKCLMHQLAQSSGKSYWKYPRVRNNGKTITLQRLNFPCPSDRLIELYERQKFKFVFELTEEFIAEAALKDKEKLLKQSRNNLSEVEQETFNLIQEGKNSTEIAEIRGVSNATVCDSLKRIRKKGFSTEIPKKIPIIRV